MKKYLYDYIKEIDDILNNNKKMDYEELRKYHLEKISFFQHERLIHLLVTLFYVIFLLAFVFLSTMFYLFFLIVFILLVFLIFYVIHYFRLENGVQYLYKQYDQILEKSGKNERIRR